MDCGRAGFEMSARVTYLRRGKLVAFLEGHGISPEDVKTMIRKKILTSHKFTGEKGKAYYDMREVEEIFHLGVARGRSCTPGGTVEL